jgi:hypothetical protein
LSKYKIIGLYVFIGLCYSIYDYFFGSSAGASFAKALGVGLAWPAAMFPAFGAVVSVIIIVVVVGVLTLS